ncbi:MAG: LysR family transcriptional regulator [Hyphomicrobium sp.]|uniref:LysR family transcriptional regulator n=1 Tax=Hyphomicrobium sp. TaxID=82 RepID=UPI003D0C0560
MNLKALRAFRLIVERGSLSVASSVLGLSQPATSRLVAMLEDELNLKLFDRSGRTLRVSESGAAFYAGTKHILAGLDEIPQIAKDIQTGEKQFKLLTTHRIAQGLVSPTLARLRKDRPKIRFSVDVLSRFELDNLIGMRRFDLAIASLPVTHALIEIENHAMFRVRLEAVLPRSHRLAAQKTVTAADLSGEDLIGLWPDQLWRQQLNDFLRAGGETGRYVVETRSSLMAWQMAADGVGIAVFDRLCARGFDLDSIVFRPLEPARWIQFGYIHHRGHSLSRNAKEFLDYLRAAISDFQRASSENAASVEFLSDDAATVDV